MDLLERIVGAVSQKRYQPVKPKALARKLGLPANSLRSFRQALKELAGQGRIEFGKNHVVRPGRPHGTVAGIFRKTSSGSGFVRPHPTEVLAGQEVFIRADSVGDASTGDEVLVRIVRPASAAGKGPGGEVIRVLERATHQFVGTYLEDGGEGLVRVDGATFTQPIYVGDAGAKGARAEDKVVFEMIRFPSPIQRGEGVITEVLGPRGQPGVDTLSIIRAFELPDRFPDDALHEARRQAEAFEETDLQGREDHTQDVIVTIDPADARDFDDAISLGYDRTRRHWRLGVHIADVAHFAPSGGALDREARQRGTSVYLPQRVLPMFPEVISNGLASLQQGKVRFVKSAFLEFTQAGQRTDARFANAAIKVTRRFSYEQVSGILQEADQGRRPPLQLDAEVHALLLRMREFAMVLRSRRIKRGALELNMPETQLEFDQEGKVTGAHFVEHDVSHQIIEEFMLAANEAVAEHLAGLGIPFLRRVHAAPDPRKLRDFLEFARTLGYEANPKRPADRFQLQRLLEESAAKPERHAVHYALLRSLKQAQYHPGEDEHYALASKDYCHFTSPIRRYPDLTVHRLLDQWLRTGRAGSDAAELVALGEHCSFTERRAEQAERELVKVKILDYLSERIGLELEIIITGVHEYGFFGLAEELPAEGLVHISTLTDDYYVYDGSTHSLCGRRHKKRYRLGDKVQAQVARVDLDRRQLDFRLVESRRRKSGRE